MKKFAIVIAALALAPVGLAACGGSDSSSSTTSSTATSTTSSGAAGGSTISISADPSGQLAFTETEVTATAGKDTLEFDNQAPIPHNVVIEDSAGKTVASTDTISGDSTSTTADLKAGTYTFFCSIDDHRAEGMEGTLTVN